MSTFGIKITPTVAPSLHFAFTSSLSLHNQGLTSFSSTEDYSYFTLRRSATPTHAATSLFGISCTRQLAASELIDRPVDVTRSTVQKALVVITDSPQHFGAIKAQLGVVTAAWFAQRYVKRATLVVPVHSRERRTRASIDTAQGFQGY